MPIPVTFDPDTGARVSIVPREVAYAMGIQLKDLRPTNARLQGFDGTITRPDRIIDAHLSFNKKSILTALYVSKAVSCALLSGRAAQQLGIVAFPHHEVRGNSATDGAPTNAIEQGISTDAKPQRKIQHEVVAMKPGTRVQVQYPDDRFLRQCGTVTRVTRKKLRIKFDNGAHQWRHCR